MERTPLKNGTEIDINGIRYQIINVLSEHGGSCLVYSAECLTIEYQPSLSTNVKTVIKEYYPKELATYIKRDKNGKLTVQNNALELFTVGKERFIKGVARQAAYYDDDSGNHSLGVPDVEEVNRTVYSAINLVKGSTLKDVNRSKLTACEVAQIMISLCNAMKKLHFKGQLYLDVKPDNVWLFDWENGESRRIALFDFDTVLNKDNLPQEGFQSNGWSPNEQIAWREIEISEATDVYAIGVLFYWLLTGEKADDELSARILWGEFTKVNKCVVLSGKPGATETARNILAITLCSEPQERINDLDKLRKEFECMNVESMDVNSPGNEATHKIMAEIRDKVFEMDRHSNMDREDKKARYRYNAAEYKGKGGNGNLLFAALCEQTANS